MKSRPQPAGRTPEPIGLDALELEKVRVQLQRVLESPPFRSSRRCSDFLRHVVEESCQGRADQLKERTLGVAVFERDPDYDTNQDPVVRNTAGQVRKRLAQYYCEPGRDKEVRIDLPAGSYVPEIQLPEQPVPVVAPPVVAAEPVPPPPLPVNDARTSRRWMVLPAIGVFLTCLGVAALLVWAWGGNDVKAFWNPLLKHSGPVVMVVGQGHTYKLSGELDTLFDQGALPADRTVPISDIVPAFDRYVGLTDVQAVVRLARVFSRFDKPIELRGGRTTSLADLRGRPAVLIGAFNNSWTLNLTGELRFFFESDPARRVEIVRDRQHLNKDTWKVPMEASAAQIRTDYAIVSRVFNPTTEQAVVVAAGIRGGGTVAAGEFLTNPTYLTHALREAPSNWAEKNVQFVLATKMIGGTPGPPTVIAAHYW